MDQRRYRPTTVNVGDQVESDPQLDPEWQLVGEVVTVIGGLAAVRITHATRRSDGTGADSTDPWRKVGCVQHSVAFLWRPLNP